MNRRPIFLMLGLIAIPSCGFAGDMDGLGYAMMLGTIYLGALVVVSLIALFACRLIADRTLRTLGRWIIVIAFYTPVVQTTPDHQSAAVPAFFYLLAGPQAPHWGWPTHPVLLAYAGALVLSAPVVGLWIYLRRRYRGRPALASASQ